jgi:hypothetical protein
MDAAGAKEVVRLADWLMFYVVTSGAFEGFFDSDSKSTRSPFAKTAKRAPAKSKTQLRSELLERDQPSVVIPLTSKEGWVHKIVFQ